MKPILIIWVPSKINFGALGIHLSMRELLEMMQEYAEDKSKDNHSVLTLPKIGSDTFEVSVYNAENTPPMEIQKLRQEVMDYFNSLSKAKPLPDHGDETQNPPLAERGSEIW